MVEKRKEFIINVIYFALIAVIIYFSIKYLLGLFMPFIFGLTVSVILRPVIRIVSKKLHLPVKLTAVVFILLFYVIFGLIISWIGVKIFSELKELLLKLPDIYFSSIEPAVNTFFENLRELVEGLEPSMAQVVQEMEKSLSSSMGTIVSSVSSSAIQGIPSVVSSVPGMFIVIAISIISSFFFAIDYDRISKYMNQKLPDRFNKFIGEIKAFSINIASKYLKGYLILMFVTFIELSVGLSILRVNNSVVIAALIACIDILPVLGTGGVLIPWIIIEFAYGEISFAIGLIVLYLIITVVRNILEPKIIGEQLGLHPLIMLICMFVGAKVFGIVGLFALPICVVVIKHFYDNGKLHFFKSK